jgi:quercetin dioxygenase-like cupin family protein
VPWTSEISTRARGSGTVWTQREGRDPNANLVRFSQGEGVGEHVNGEVDALFVGVSGSGVVEVDGREHALGPGALILAPKEFDGPPEARPRIFPTSPCAAPGGV